MSEPSPQEQLFRYITGCFASQAVFVAAKLGIADILASGPQSVDELAGTTTTHPPSLYRLLRALASLGIFAEEQDGRFTLTPLAEPLRRDVPGSMHATAVMMGSEFYQAWGALLDSVRTGEPAFRSLYGCTYFEYLANHPEVSQTFDAAMTELNQRKTAAMLDAYDFSEFSTLADVGGGNGGTLIAILGRFPTMRGLLFDVPSVVERATDGIAKAGLAERCDVTGGSFLETVPAGADAYLLRHIVHNWDDEHALAILKNVHRAMGRKAKLLVVDRVIPPGNAPLFGKLQDLTMLVVHGGRERTETEFEQLFADAGFELSRVVPTSLDVCVLEGERADIG
jgi:O-methyltransferase domain/Dimerisation domain